MLNKKVEPLTSFAVIASQLSKFDHIPVMLKESIDLLNVRKNGIYVDATLGQGGHSEIIAKLLKGQGKIIGIDQDPEAIRAAKEKLVRSGDLMKFVHNNFKNLEIILDELNIKKVDGILLDLGVSAEQLKNPKRGFSFSENAENLNSKLDMRMNTLQNISAYDVLNKYRENELKDIFLNLGEEHYIYSKKIAKRIVQERTKKPITTVNDLLVIIKSTMPPKYRFRKRSHYASKIFRAIRMEVNQELPALQEIIPQAINKLKKGG
ncbi:MAG: 16S rRNA (cytosine(1402)-N(4))-methyltransferase RsmH, partial [Candidatus Pacebacteria bacterium]|nr:16S rRNA (cytosine(1402)-N(4))-methyltransferase RsmH [Candidatus Paceibacterota bacterium]